jgi:hypothetical protein
MLIIAGDVELNPGPGETPVNFEDHCLSIFHGNIRSLRNKVDYISNIIEDYDIVFFTENNDNAVTLDRNIVNPALINLKYLTYSENSMSLKRK